MKGSLDDYLLKLLFIRITKFKAMDNCFLDTSNNEDDGVSLDADPCGELAQVIS